MSSSGDLGSCVFEAAAGGVGPGKAACALGVSSPDRVSPELHLPAQTEA